MPLSDYIENVSDYCREFLDDLSYSYVEANVIELSAADMIDW